jgi:hypothetical protein
VQAQEGGIMIEGKYAGDPTSITMQLVCKIKSEIIIIIIIIIIYNHSHNSETHGNKKKHCFFCTNVTHNEGLKKSGRQYTKSKIEGFAFVYWRRSRGGRRYAGLNGGG